MDGLLDFVTPDQRKAIQEQALTQSLLSLGPALLQASTGAPGQGKPRFGQILGQAVPVGVQAYQGGIDQALRQLLAGQQMQEMQRRRQQEILASNRQAQIQRAMAIPDMKQRVEALTNLGAYKELSEMGAGLKAVRPLMREPGQPDMTSPFLIYKQSEVPSVRKLAEQLDKSWQTGGLPEEKVNVRLGELARLEDRALSRKESAAERKLTREEMKVERQINREAQQAERERSRLEGTESQKLSAGFVSRMEAANKIIEQLESTGGLPTTGTSIAGSIPFIGGYAQRKVMSPEQQRYKQAADNWIRANLRKESGAAIPSEEMALEYETYFPMPGDDPETIAQKAEARKITTEAMKKNAGPVYRPTTGATRPDLKNIKSNYGLE